MAFESSVFINCPFDYQYSNLLKPLIFTVIFLELEPQVSETKSSGNVRVEQIKKLILSSKFSIHDISRSEALNAGEFPRFNMPFEMGLDLGCQSFRKGRFGEKKCLILEKTRYHYQKVVSDIAGQDIEFHNDDPQMLIRKVRNWFTSILGNHFSSPTVIWQLYNEFYVDITETLKNKEGFSDDDVESIPYSNFISLAKKWIATFKQTKNTERISSKMKRRQSRR